MMMWLKTYSTFLFFLALFDVNAHTVRTVFLEMLMYLNFLLELFLGDCSNEGLLIHFHGKS